jgi:hypothetical protein
MAPRSYNASSDSAAIHTAAESGSSVVVTCRLHRDAFTSVATATSPAASRTLGLSRFECASGATESRAHSRAAEQGVEDGRG